MMSSGMYCTVVLSVICQQSALPRTAETCSLSKLNHTAHKYIRVVLNRLHSGQNTLQRGGWLLGGHYKLAMIFTQ